MTVPPVTPYSLRRRLLLWLLVPLVLIGVVALVETYRSARLLADQVSDRVLAGSAQAIGERVVVGDDGALEVDIPYVALDMLTSAAQDRVFYRIDGPPGTFITGYQGLPEPDAGADPHTGLSFRDAVFRNEPIRVAVLNGAASTGLSSIPFRVTVAETTNARQRLSEDILLRSAARQGVLILSAAIIVWLAVSAGLRPLYRLEAALGRRSSDELRPIEHRVPREVGGLVSTINNFMARLAAALDALRHFTGNASHQLRTPLAIIRTELALAKRANRLPQPKAPPRTPIGPRRMLNGYSRNSCFSPVSMRRHPKRSPGGRPTLPGSPAASSPTTFAGPPPAVSISVSRRAARLWSAATRCFSAKCCPIWSRTPCAMPVPAATRPSALPAVKIRSWSKSKTTGRASRRPRESAFESASPATPAEASRAPALAFRSLRR